jgi:hypothetical protein
VETGVRTASRVQILSGLGAGDTVVTSGLPQLRHGSPVIPETRAATIARR